MYSYLSVSQYRVDIIIRHACRPEGFEASLRVLRITEFLPRFISSCRRRHCPEHEFYQLVIASTAAVERTPLGQKTGAEGRARTYAIAWRPAPRGEVARLT